MNIEILFYEPIIVQTIFSSEYFMISNFKQTKNRTIILWKLYLKTYLLQYWTVVSIKEIVLRNIFFGILWDYLIYYISNFIRCYFHHFNIKLVVEILISFLWFFFFNEQNYILTITVKRLINVRKYCFVYCTFKFKQ